MPEPRLTIPLASARALLLAAQGFQANPPPATRDAVRAAIRRMGALQIDTINVVARSHLFVLWSRLGAFEPRWLDELLAEQAIFEYWSHAACFLPIEDFRLYRPAMLSRRQHRRPLPERLLEWKRLVDAAVPRVLERLRTEGALRAADFERQDGKKGQWWDRKPEKWALEELFDHGIVTVARRERFQRIYDLLERVLGEWSDAALPSDAEVRRELTLKSVRALGVAPARWVPDYFRQKKTGFAAYLKDLAAEGALVEARIPELGDSPVYVHPDHLETARAAASGELQSDVTTLLSPFDPVVWDRARASELFGFDYRIEVYTPAERRKFGYFTLPILHRGALIGRLCPKAHRKEGTFEVRQLHLEDGVSVTDDLVTPLAAALRACAAWHGTPEVVIRESDTPGFAAAVRSRLEAPAHA